MPRASNDIDYVKWKDPRTKKLKNPPLEPWALPPFTPLQIDDYFDLGEPSIPPSLDQHNPLAIFSLFFTDKILERMVEQINKYVETHLTLEDKALRGRPKKWIPMSRRELYAYFSVVIYIGIMIELVVEDYWGLIIKGAAYKVANYISKNRFKQLERYICCSPMPQDGFHTTFNRVDKLSKHLRVLCRKFWRPSPYLAVDKTIQRFMGRAPKIINILLKPILEGFKIQILANQGYILNWLQYAKGDKKGPVDLNKAFLNKGFIKTQAVILNLLTQRHPTTNKRLYPPGKHVVWLDNLFSSVKLFKRLRSLGIGAAGTVRTTRTRREEIGEEECNVQEEISEVKPVDLARSTISILYIKKQIKRKKKVPIEAFLALLIVTDYRTLHITLFHQRQYYPRISRIRLK